MSQKKVPVEKLDDFVPLLSPSRPILVTTRFATGRINVAPFAWCTPISVKPPMLTLALLKTPRRQRSLINILRDGQFIINIPTPELAERVVRASYWYPKGVNKLEELGFTTGPAQVLDLPILTECRAHVECRLKDSLTPGDHTLLIADVVAASYDEGTFGPGMMMDLEKVRPLLHLRHVVGVQGQAHIFFTGDQTRIAYAPFPVGGMDANGKPTGDEED